MSTTASVEMVTSFHEDWIPIKYLGGGGQGDVWLCIPAIALDEGVPDAPVYAAVKVSLVESGLNPFHSIKKERAILLNMQQGASPPKRLLTSLKADTHDRPVWLATPFITGCTMEALVDEIEKQKKSSSASFALHALLQLLESFRYIHTGDKNTGKWAISHQDLQMQNIMIQLDGTTENEFPNVVPIDFGMAYYCEADQMNEFFEEEQMVDIESFINNFVDIALACEQNYGVEATNDEALTLLEDDTFHSLCDLADSMTVEMIEKDYGPWAKDMKDRLNTPEAVQFIRDTCERIMPKLPSREELINAVEKWKASKIRVAWTNPGKLRACRPSE
ncbi:hypothetical protein NA57DRAFT_76120 [Rhizodiscina lignyota]|uniref:Protein kinase domain-containing protein n=1 Tax=Rhizodiscina lignyota TaxID=1504668 RepID=A0A9P4IC75_9PEZI|nr:hypothetical protein NA57DRAFT_76120 [Rhizodiscina lignyota]